MAATVQIHEMSAITTGVDRTAGNGPVVFRNNDSNAQDGANPVQVPVAGTNYSFTKQIRINVTIAPATQIENVRAYSEDSQNDLGVGVGIQYDVNATFQTQVDSNIVGTDFFTSSSGSPIVLGAGPFVGTGYFADLLRLQLTVADTAQPGPVANDEGLVVAYDES